MAPPPTPPVPKSYEHAERRDWPAYYASVEGRPPRDTLVKALELFAREPDSPLPRTAIDLGSGSGRDTRLLLSKGWSVLAIDSSPVGLEMLTASIPEADRPRLTTRQAPFEGLTLPPATLVNASYSLPFCEPAHFAPLWMALMAAIPVQGRFCGQLFGERDAWAVIPDRSHHTRTQVDTLFERFNLEDLKEIENREPTATGDIKNWHIFHIVAKRRA